MNSFQNPKFNPQARFSAVAEAVALADAEDRGETSNSQAITQYQNVVRRRPAPSSSRPLSTFLTDSVDAANHPNAHDNGLLENTSNSQAIPQYQNVVRRRPAPSSSRPLSTFLPDSVDVVNHPNAHHNGLLDNNPIPVRRRPAPTSNRPLSTFLTDSVGVVNHPDAQHNGLLENNPIPKRKPRPASMAVIPPIETAPECFYCLGEGTHLCNWCRAVYYCGPSHYNIHRCHSKCWPFKVKGLICQERIRII